jgi:hypothetical protein
VATGGGGAAVTVNVAKPVFPSLAAVICVLPVLRAVMAPVDDTEATAEVVYDHVTVRPVSVAPVASLSVAVA